MACGVQGVIGEPVGVGISGAERMHDLPFETSQRGLRFFVEGSQIRRFHFVLTVDLPHHEFAIADDADVFGARL